jgi:uncharacterized protein GlcG (DUF336 family)
MFRGEGDSYSEHTVETKTATHSNIRRNCPMKHLARTALFTAVIAASFSTAQAQAVRTERNMSLELANQLAAAGVAACAADGYAVTTTVVDRAGSVRAVQRADNAGPHTLGASQGKAFTSASAKNTTLAMRENAQKNPAAAVKVGNEVIGAVGIGGAPGGHLDEKCALAAIDKLKDQLQ